MGHWINWLTRFIKKTDSFSNETLMCAAWRHNSSALALIVTIFGWEIEQKHPVFCLQSKSLDFNFLFIEILLYKISVTLQSCWYSGQHHGRIMLLPEIIFCKCLFVSTTVCIYKFWVTLCVLSLSNTHSGRSQASSGLIHALSTAVYTECH